MAGSSLREELLRVPGVAEAEVDETGDTPAGVRVRLAPEADARTVGAEVQRVLAAHGMRSRVTGPDDVPEPAPFGVPGMADVTELPTVPPMAAMPPPPGNPPPMVPVAPEPAPPTISAVPSEPVSASIEAPLPSPVFVSDAGLAALRIEETDEGISVTAVATDGRALTQRSGPSEAGLFEAVVSAVGALAEGRAPEMISVESAGEPGSEVVTVVVERADGTRVAGAAMVKAGKAFAVAKATWTAVRGG